jgi:hypothetical protein
MNGPLERASFEEPVLLLSPTNRVAEGGQEDRLMRDMHSVTRVVIKCTLIISRTLSKRTHVIIM